MAEVQYESMYVHNEATGNTVGFRVAKTREVEVERGGKTEKVKVVDPRREILQQRVKRGELSEGKASDVKRAKADA